MTRRISFQVPTLSEPRHFTPFTEEELPPAEAPILHAALVDTRRFGLRDAAEHRFASAVAGLARRLRALLGLARR